MHGLMTVVIYTVLCTVRMTVVIYKFLAEFGDIQAPSGLGDIHSCGVVMVDLLRKSAIKMCY